MICTKYEWIVMLIVLVCSVVFAASPAFNRWEGRYSDSIRLTTPQPHEYEALIAELEKGVKDLKAERDVLLKSKENTTFVSMAALRATGYELKCLVEPPTDYWIYLLSTNQIEDGVFTKWIAKAQKWDEAKKWDELTQLGTTSR